MNIEYVKNPSFSNPENTGINCTVKFSEISVEIEFHATPNDDEPHGVEIFTRCLAGEFGEIASWEEPPTPEHVLTPPENEIPKTVL